MRRKTDGDALSDGQKGAGKPEKQGGVQSIGRALAILDALAANEDGLSLTALSRAVDLPPSSAHRLLTTLQLNHFVRFEPTSMTWRVGVQAFVVGAAFARSREVTPIAMPFMRQLMEKTGETVNLYIPNNGQAVCIAQVQSRQAISAISRPGGGLPLHLSAAGKAILATLPDPAVERTLAEYAGEQKPAPRELRKVLREVGRIRASAYALDDEAVAAGLRCIAAPILDENGVAHAALSIAGPTLRLTDERIPRLADFVVSAGKAVTSAFGGRVAGAKSKGQGRPGRQPSPGHGPARRKPASRTI